MTDVVRLGQLRPTRMRRIGERHMIVMPQQQAQLLSVDDVERTLATTRAQIAQMTQQTDRLRAMATDLEQQLAAFKALPIARVEDDPSVPQPELTRPLRTLRDDRLLQGPAGTSTPVPPPELIANDG